MKIDFVITWVDGNDPEWLKDFNKYKNNIGDTRVARYREWGTLKYLFRGFEKFTPWVNKIYFVTYGHLPNWLNINHPKLKIIKHQDFLLTENLPVFSSHPIEINLHRIEGLSEYFVYFNDDTFITAPIKSERFFKKGLPTGTAISHIMHIGEIAHIVSNDLAIINKHFNKHKSIIKNFWKWFYPGYGLNIYRTICLFPWKVFTGFYNYHHPQPFLKSTFEEVWQKEEELLKKVSASKFRNSQDVNQYLFRYWQFAKGDFYPISYKDSYKKSKYIEVSNYEDAKEVARDLESKKFQLYCPNDNLVEVNDEEYFKSLEIIIKSFDKIFPEKSEFEK